MTAAISVWWAVGIGVFDLVVFVLFIAVMFVAVKRAYKSVGPLLKMLQGPPQ